MKRRICASKIILHKLSTMTSVCCGVEQLHSSRPSATKQNSRTARKWNPDTKREIRAVEWGRDRDESKYKREQKCQLRSCHENDKKNLLCLAFESITAVWLSSYRSLSVNAVSPISLRRVCMCVCVLSGDCDQCDSESVLRFFFLISFLFLSYLVSPVSISTRNRCLYSLCTLKRSQTACCRKQVWNEKGQITRGWWSWGGKEWKGERFGQITKEGEREETAENNIIRRKREMTGERKSGGEGARGECQSS